MGLYSYTFLGLLLICPLSHTLPQNLTSPDNISKYGLALEAIFGMGIRVQTLLGEDNDENFLVSPLGLTLTIGQLMIGADDAFRDQLYILMSLPDQGLQNDRIHHIGKYKNESYAFPYKTLHLQLRRLLTDLEGNSSGTKSFNLKQKSAVFYSNELMLDERFRKFSEVLYLTEMQKLNFAEAPQEAQRVVNEWASRNTNGLIRTILSAPPPPSTASIFANAIYFSAQWETPFSDVLNRNGSFNVSKNKSVTVTYMIGFQEGILYQEANDYRLIGLPYVNEELNMFIILPNSDHPYAYDMKRFTQSLKANDVFRSITGAPRRNVLVKIPKMSLSNRVSVLKQLQKFQAYRKTLPKVPINNETKDAVDKLEDTIDDFSKFAASNVDDLVLTRAARNQPLRVNDIVQQMFFSVNEKGTEAAVVTASTIDYSGGNKNFVIDRPFLFFIRHEATSAILFWGTIGNPAA